MAPFFVMTEAKTPVTVRALRAFNSTAHGSVSAGQMIDTTLSRSQSWIDAKLVEVVSSDQPAPTQSKPLGNDSARSSRSVVTEPAAGTAKRSSASRPAPASAPKTSKRSAKPSKPAKRAR